MGWLGEVEGRDVDFGGCAEGGEDQIGRGSDVARREGLRVEGMVFSDTDIPHLTWLNLFIKLKIRKQYSI